MWTLSVTPISARGEVDLQLLARCMRTHVGDKAQDRTSMVTDVGRLPLCPPYFVERPQEAVETPRRGRMNAQEAFR